MNWVRATVQVYAAMFRDGVNFAQASYGDGEFMCILGRYPATNGNGERFSAELGAQLARTITEPAGQWCEMWPEGTAAHIRQDAERWVEAHGGNATWVASRPLARAGADVVPALQALRERRVILVGPEHLAAVPPCVLRPAHHVIVDTHKASERWRDTVDEVSRVRNAGDVVLVAAGMAANLIVHRLSALYGRTITAFDVGAMFDPYAGVVSRNSHRKWADDRAKVLKELR